MAYTFFYTSILIIIIIFIICSKIKRPGFDNILIGITTVGYTMVFEIIFGDRFKLYYYITPQVSTLYMVLSAIFIYPVVNIIYTLFIPKETKKVMVYTGLWIAAMLVFEYASVKTGTVVFTGWQPVPWSFVTYVFTYLWICSFYNFLNKLMYSCRI